MRTGIIIGFAPLTAIPISIGAPAPKAQEEKLGPITLEQLAEANNNLKHIALGWHIYEAAHGDLPSNQHDAKGKPLLSWRVQILPFIEEEELYKQFKMDEPWDSESNKKLIEKMPKVYKPIRVKRNAGLTFYQSSRGKHGVLKDGQKLSFANFLDGTSNTFLVVESAKPVTWTKPDDLECDGKKLPALGGMFDGKFHAAYCDGSIRRFKKGIADELLAKLLDPADGQVIDINNAEDD